MKYKNLGNSIIKVSPLAFGGNVFGWTINEKASFELLDAFSDYGFNFIDTADVYSRWAEGNDGGESETIIGKWLKRSGKRQNSVIATKVGSDMGQGKKGLRKNYIIEAANASLKRLQTDYIDLYQTHFDEEVTPVNETLEAYQELVKAGKVRLIGTSNMSAERIRESVNYSRDNGLPVYQTLQPLYNLYEREKFEEEYQPLVEELGLDVITYFSLASGFLTGKYRSEADLDKSKRGGGVQKYLNKRGFAILEALDKVAQKHDAQPAEIALAWLQSHPFIAAPIASATGLEQLKSLVRSTEIRLDSESLDMLYKASSYKK